MWWKHHKLENWLRKQTNWSCDCFHWACNIYMCDFWWAFSSVKKKYIFSQPVLTKVKIYGLLKPDAMGHLLCAFLWWIDFDSTWRSAYILSADNSVWVWASGWAFSISRGRSWNQAQPGIPVQRLITAHLMAQQITRGVHLIKTGFSPLTQLLLPLQASLPTHLHAS